MGGRTQRAFTLLEVMIAMTIFLLAVFAILGVVAQNLRIARGLSMGEVDVGTVAAEIVTTTNLSEGSISGDFGDAYPGASWMAELTLVGTNGSGPRVTGAGHGLFQADIVIDWPQNGLVKQKKTSILVYNIQGSGAGTGPGQGNQTPRTGGAGRR